MRSRPALTLSLLLLVASPALAGHEVLARGEDGALLHVDASGRATSVGGAIVGMPGAAMSGDRLDVVVRGTDDALWAVSRQASAWSGFERVGGVLTGPPSAVARDGGLDVVARGDDGACWHVRRAAGGWGEWTSLGGAFDADATFGLASRDAGSLDVFARGQDGALWHAQLGHAGWRPFAALGDGRRLGSAPAACAPGADRIDVVALAPDLSAQVLTWQRAGWSSWTSLGGTFAAASSLAIAAPAPDRLVVAGLGTDGRIWTSEAHAGRWGAWRSLGDARPSSPVALVAIVTPPVASATHGTPASSVAVPPTMDVAPGAAVAVPPTIAASALVDLDPGQHIRLDRPRERRPDELTIAVTPETLRRLEAAPTTPFPGCDPARPCVRVTLLGFTLVGDTGDPAGDGPGDEVSVRADIWHARDGRYATAEPLLRETKVHGSRPAGATGAAARRVRAGSASPDGGLARGDRHPSHLSVSSPLGAEGEVPLRLFEGPLDGAAGLRMVLSAWEVDGGEGPRACCRAWNYEVASSAWDSIAAGSWTGAVELTTPVAERERRDRPYGTLENLAAVAVLGSSLADWRSLAARSGLQGTGVLALDFADFDGSARLVAHVHVEIVE